MPILTLYSTVGCHLCELAKEQITPLLGQFSCELVEIDIANNDQLLEQYGIHIPVVMINTTGSEIFWPFDSESLTCFLKENS